jgi:hypothetical protein
MSVALLVLLLVSGDGDYLCWAQMSRFHLKTQRIAVSETSCFK